MTLRETGSLGLALTTDGITADSNNPSRSALSLIYNGATWDRLRGGEATMPLLGAARVVELVNPTLQSDATPDDSDKTLTVPADTLWRVLWIYVILSSDATVGNRQVSVEYRDVNNNGIAGVTSVITQPASVAYGQLFLPNGIRDAAVVNDQFIQPLPGLSWLPAGYNIRIRDKASVSATGDDMTLRVMVDERDVAA